MAEPAVSEESEPVDTELSEGSTGDSSQHVAALTDVYEPRVANVATDHEPVAPNVATDHKHVACDVSSDSGIRTDDFGPKAFKDSDNVAANDPELVAANDSEIVATSDSVSATAGDSKSGTVDNTEPVKIDDSFLVPEVKVDEPLPRRHERRAKTFAKVKIVLFNDHIDENGYIHSERPSRNPYLPVKKRKKLCQFKVKEQLVKKPKQNLGDTEPVNSHGKKAKVNTSSKEEKSKKLKMRSRPSDSKRSILKENKSKKHVTLDSTKEEGITSVQCEIETDKSPLMPEKKEKDGSPMPGKKIADPLLFKQKKKAGALHPGKRKKIVTKLANDSSSLLKQNKAALHDDKKKIGRPPLNDKKLMKGVKIVKRRDGKPEVYCCHHCTYKTKNKYYIKRHIMIHDKPKISFECHYCEYITRSIIRYKEHEATHTHEKPFKCEHCEYSSRSNTDFQRHQAKHATEKKYKCPHCEFKTKWSRNVRHHVLKHTTVRPHKCDICGFSFKRIQDLKYHLYRHNDVKPIACESCEFKCKTNYELKCHMLKHSDVRYFACTFPGCVQQTKTKSDLTKHMNIHNSEKKYICGICQKGFNAKCTLAKHVRIHGERQLLKCDICQKGFKTRASLQGHLRLHLGVYPFSCNICQRRFAVKWNLVKHQETHILDDRPYRCPICPYGARTIEHLLTHIGSMHGKSYAYFCEICRKPFKRFGQLRIHMRRMHSAALDQKAAQNMQSMLREVKPDSNISMVDMSEDQQFENQTLELVEVKHEQISELENDGELKLTITSIKSEPSGSITDANIPQVHVSINTASPISVIGRSTDPIKTEDGTTSVTRPVSGDGSEVPVSHFSKNSAVDLPVGVESSASSENLAAGADSKEEKPLATVGIYNGFTLPLATKGFEFNLEKRGKKPDSWFMDLRNMHKKAAAKHKKYLYKKERGLLQIRKPKLTKEEKERRRQLKQELKACAISCTVSSKSETTLIFHTERGIPKLKRRRISKLPNKKFKSLEEAGAFLPSSEKSKKTTTNQATLKRKPGRKKKATGKKSTKSFNPIIEFSTFKEESGMSGPALSTIISPFIEYSKTDLKLQPQVNLTDIFSSAGGCVEFAGTYETESKVHLSTTLCRPTACISNLPSNGTPKTMPKRRGRPRKGARKISGQGKVNDTKEISPVSNICAMMNAPDMAVDTLTPVCRATETGSVEPSVDIQPSDNTHKLVPKKKGRPKKEHGMIAVKTKGHIADAFSETDGLDGHRNACETNIKVEVSTPNEFVDNQSWPNTQKIAQEKKGHPKKGIRIISSEPEENLTDNFPTRGCSNLAMEISSPVLISTEFVSDQLSHNKQNVVPKKKGRPKKRTMKISGEPKRKATDNFAPGDCVGVAVSTSTPITLVPSELLRDQSLHGKLKMVARKKGRPKKGTITISGEPEGKVADRFAPADDCGGLTVTTPTPETSVPSELLRDQSSHGTLKVVPRKKGRPKKGNRAISGEPEASAADSFAQTDDCGEPTLATSIPETSVLSELVNDQSLHRTFKVVPKKKGRPKKGTRKPSMLIGNATGSIPPTNGCGEMTVVTSTPVCIIPEIVDDPSHDTQKMVPKTKSGPKKVTGMTSGKPKGNDGGCGGIMDACEAQIKVEIPPVSLPTDMTEYEDDQPLSMLSDRHKVVPKKKGCPKKGPGKISGKRKGNFGDSLYSGGSCGVELTAPGKAETLVEAPTSVCIPSNTPVGNQSLPEIKKTIPKRRGRPKGGLSKLSSTSKGTALDESTWPSVVPLAENHINKDGREVLDNQKNSLDPTELEEDIPLIYYSSRAKSIKLEPSESMETTSNPGCSDKVGPIIPVNKTQPTKKKTGRKKGTKFTRKKKRSKPQHSEQSLEPDKSSPTMDIPSTVALLGVNTASPVVQDVNIPVRFSCCSDDLKVTIKRERAEGAQSGGEHDSSMPTDTIESEETLYGPAGLNLATSFTCSMDIQSESDKQEVNTSLLQGTNHVAEFSLKCNKKERRSRKINKNKIKRKLRKSINPSIIEVKQESIQAGREEGAVCATGEFLAFSQPTVLDKQDIAGHVPSQIKTEMRDENIPESEASGTVMSDIPPETMFVRLGNGSVMGDIEQNVIGCSDQSSGLDRSEETFVSPTITGQTLISATSVDSPRQNNFEGGHLDEGFSVNQKITALGSIGFSVPLVTSVSAERRWSGSSDSVSALNGFLPDKETEGQTTEIARSSLQPSTIVKVEPEYEDISDEEIPQNYMYMYENDRVVLSESYREGSPLNGWVTT